MLLQLCRGKIILFTTFIYHIVFNCLFPPGCHSFHLQICCIQSCNASNMFSCGKQRSKEIHLILYLWIWREILPWTLWLWMWSAEHSSPMLKQFSLSHWCFEVCHLLLACTLGWWGGGGGGSRAAKSWNSLSFGLKLSYSYCAPDDFFNCPSCLASNSKNKNSHRLSCTLRVGTLAHHVWPVPLDCALKLL